MMGQTDKDNDRASATGTGITISSNSSPAETEQQQQRDSEAAVVISEVVCTYETTSSSSAGFRSRSRRPQVEFGTRGDPRMNRAVEVKMANPGMPLAVALQNGGFSYPADANGAAMDDENVTLAQRKNQLSRRLRRARFMTEEELDSEWQQSQSQLRPHQPSLDQVLGGGAGAAAGSNRSTENLGSDSASLNGTDRAANGKRARTDQASTTGIVDLSASVQPYTTSSSPAAAAAVPIAPRQFLWSNSAGRVLAAPEQQTRAPPTDPDFAAVAAALTGGVATSATDYHQPQCQQQHQNENRALLTDPLAYLNHNGDGQHQEQQQPLHRMQPHVTLQAAVLQQQQQSGQHPHVLHQQEHRSQQQPSQRHQDPHQQLKSHLMNLSMVNQQPMQRENRQERQQDQQGPVEWSVPSCAVTNPSSTSTMHGGDGDTVATTTTTLQLQCAYAINLFQRQVETLYSNCLQQAGFPPEQTEEASPVFQQFASVVWNKEWNRLQSFSASLPSQKAPTSAQEQAQKLRQQHAGSPSPGIALSRRLHQVQKQERARREQKEQEKDLSDQDKEEMDPRPFRNHHHHRHQNRFVPAASVSPNSRGAGEERTTYRGVATGSSKGGSTTSSAGPATTTGSDQSGDDGNQEYYYSGSSS